MTNEEIEYNFQRLDDLLAEGITDICKRLEYLGRRIEKIDSTLFGIGHSAQIHSEKLEVLFHIVKRNIE